MQIDMRGVTKTFGSVVALDALTLTIPSGAKVGLVGPNGSGKSTLIRVLMGLLRADGHVDIDGHHPMDGRGALARRIAYVPQIAPHFAAPVHEVVRTIAGLRGVEPAAFTRTAERLGLALDDVRDRPFRGLSGGMRHKLLIALALSVPVSLLVLDEPTSSLDADTRDSFFRLCSEATRSTTLVLCSHHVEEMRHLVNHVVALNEGRLVYDGSASQYLEEKAVSVIQVCVADGDAQPWLRERGFSVGVDGWWARTVTHSEKVSLLPDLVMRLRGVLRDVQIHEVERLDGEGSRPNA